MDAETIVLPPNSLYMSNGTVTADGVVVGRRRRAVLRIWGGRARLEFRMALVRAPERPLEVLFEPNRHVDGRTVSVLMKRPILSADGVVYEVVGRGWQVTLDEVH